MNNKQFKTYGIALGVVVLIFISVAVANSAGYRFTSKGFVKAGSLEIFVEKSGSKIFVDNEKEATTSKDNETVTIRNISPGSHDLLISKDGFWPWIKQISVKKEELKKLNSFMVRTDAQGVIIPEADPEYDSIISKLESTTVPTKSDPKISNDSRASVWVEGQTVYYKWDGPKEEALANLCGKNTESEECASVVIFRGTENIANLDFYSSRNDVISLSTSNGIFAIEANTESVQNFQPIYKGTSIGPKFFIDKIDNLLYAKDGNLLMIINI